jgi:multidrug efflux pump subunit AcrA (membrane-fusion protein)
VVRIATKGVSTSNVVTFEVKIEVTSDNRMLLKPMMTANVEIVSSEKKDVLLVPMNGVARKSRDGEATTGAATASAGPTSANGSGEAVAANGSEPATQPGSGKRGRRAGEKSPRYTPVPIPGSAVVLKADGTKETRDVLIGMDDEVHYEIIQGLEEGETVVLNKAGSNSRFSGGRRAMRAMGGG